MDQRLSGLADVITSTVNPGYEDRFGRLSATLHNGHGFSLKAAKKCCALFIPDLQ